MRKNLAGYKYSLIMCLIIGFQFAVTKKVIIYFKTRELAFLFWRFAFAALTFFIYITLSAIIHKKKSKEVRKYYEVLIDKKILLLCFISPFLNLITQTYCVRYSDVALIAYITATGPFVALGVNSLVTKKPTDKTQLLHVLLCVAGAVIGNIGKTDFEKTTLLGAALCLGALISRSLYASLVQQEKNKYETSIITFAQILFCALAFFLSAAVFGQLKDSFEILLQFDIKTWLFFFYLCFLSSLMLLYLNNASLNNISAVTVGIINNLTFIVTLISGMIFFDNKIETLDIIGSGVIILGVVLNAIKTQKNRSD